jgi:insulysin
MWQTILRATPLLLVTQFLTQIEVDAFSMKSPFLLAAFQSKNNALSSTLTDEDTTSKQDMCNDDIHASKILADDETFIKPQLDKRAYRAIELPNHLQILLVSDPKTDIEAASVHIKAGHFDDPVDRAGLAHFHEHMVFLGTEKYPEENDFESFLGRNGGTSNAYTDMEDTNFYFNVAPLDHLDNPDEEEGATTSGEEKRNVSQALAGALDRFAQFFISPLFSESMVERELRAIDSEYLNGMTSDSWKQFQLLKNSANTSHPFGKFGCGNYNTLTNGGTLDKGQDAEASGGSNPRDVLVNFWEENYVAENMRVCVVGRSSLDDLQHIMESTFAKVRSSGQNLDAHIVLHESDNKVFTKENAKYGVKAFGPSQLGKYQEIIPMVEKRSIRLLFATPPFDDPAMLAARPYKALSHILGHESPGSLHSLLLEEGYINDLSSGVGITASDFSLTSLSLPLTPKGMEHKDHVINMVWQWIALIKETVLNNPHVIETYFEECTQMSKLAFQFRENGDPTDFCSAGSEGMFDYEPSEILLAMSAAVPYDNDVVKAFLDRFTPQNCIITSYDPSLENESDTNTSVPESECSAAGKPWETEKWYQAKYRQVDISQTLMDKWSKISISDVDPRLRLPDLNTFLPSDFSLRSEDEEAMTSFDPETDYSKEMPELIMDRPGLQLWHKMDRTFNIPKTFLRLLLTSP